MNLNIDLRIIGLIIFNIGMGRLLDISFKDLFPIHFWIIWFIIGIVGNFFIVMMTIEGGEKK